MERVTDELISYIEQNALLAAARKAVNRRLKLEAHGGLSVVHDSRWRYVRHSWKDQAEDLYVEWIEIGYKIDCASVSEDDPDYVVVTNHGDYGRTHYYVFEKSLREPDVINDCRYLVAFWENNECVWAAPFFTFREADDFAFGEATKYCVEHGIERRYDPPRAESAFMSGNYIYEQVQDRYWSNEDHAEIRVTTIEYGQERYPHEYEQEVA